MGRRSTITPPVTDRHGHTRSHSHGAPMNVQVNGTFRVTEAVTKGQSQGCDDCDPPPRGDHTVTPPPGPHPGADVGSTETSPYRTGSTSMSDRGGPRLARARDPHGSNVCRPKRPPVERRPLGTFQPQKGHRVPTHSTLHSTETPHDQHDRA
jgi:hypothetical protein